MKESVKSGDLYFEKDFSGVDHDNLPVVQWYPGHIAKSERKLKEELKILDVIIEVRDARIINATTHPLIQEWLEVRKNKKHILLLNRLDMISAIDKQSWDQYFKSKEQDFFWTIGNESQPRSGILEVKRKLLEISRKLNKSMEAKMRRPRPPRVCVIGFPNVGKSSIVNRLLNRRVCQTAPRPGVTRHLSWSLIGSSHKGLHVLDSPGLIPTSLADQTAARKIAMCNNIGDASYMDSLIAAQLIHTIKGLPESVEIMQRVKERYSLDPWALSHEDFVEELGQKLFKGNQEQAGCRILKDFRELKLGKFALESPKLSDFV
eukprot:g4977.t1